LKSQACAIREDKVLKEISVGTSVNMDLEVVRTIVEIRDRVASARLSGKTVGLVPTMGALHEGHARLIDMARRETAWTVVSIFVNPLQFAPDEDYLRYPRDLSADVSMCRRYGVDLVFAPEVETMFPAEQLTTVEVSRVSHHLCGAHRPGHFRGVATIVLKLLNIIRPDRAYFGEKDAQQLAVIRRMIKDLNLDITIVEVPTFREVDGLALSSRNQYLSHDERRAAPALNRALRAAQQLVIEGVRSPTQVRQAALAVLEQEPLVRVEYVEAVDPDEMQPVSEITGPVRVLAAIWIGKARLIDNLLCIPE
jgi:pantoate--beta-alanine ligase